MEPSVRPQRFEWLNPTLHSICVAIAASAGVASFVAYRHSQVLDAWIAFIGQLLPLEMWSLKSSYPAATAAYMSFAWPIYPMSAILTFRKSLYPPVGSLGLPYALKQRLLLPWFALFLLALSVGGVIAFRGQDTRYIHFGTDIYQLVWLGWAYPLVAGVAAGMSAVILWKSISGK